MRLLQTLRPVTHITIKSPTRHYVTSIHLKPRSFSSSYPTYSPRPLSPYRYPSALTFINTFSPLHSAGWRIRVLPCHSPPTTNNVEHRLPSKDYQKVERWEQLQMHRLVKTYLFNEWKEAIRFMRRIEELVEEHDHHPSILIGPALDHPSKKWSQAKGYIVEVSTHTHTPLSYIEPGTPKKATEDKPLPGITGKDLGFAQELEEVHRELSRMV